MTAYQIVLRIYLIFTDFCFWYYAVGDNLLMQSNTAQRDLSALNKKQLNVERPDFVIKSEKNCKRRLDSLQ